MLLISVLPSGMMRAQSEKTLTILHTNDTHSCIMPLSRHLADTMQAGRGGFLRRIAMLKEERKQDSDLLLFDSGDFSQGSPYYTLFKGDVESGLMNLMHYDAGTIGNHEFDFGLENMARVFRNLNFPIVCSNYKFHEFDLDRIVKPYVILRRRGIKIGVFGLGPPARRTGRPQELPLDRVPRSCDDGAADGRPPSSQGLSVRHLPLPPWLGGKRHGRPGSD